MMTSFKPGKFLLSLSKNPSRIYTHLLHKKKRYLSAEELYYAWCKPLTERLLDLKRIWKEQNFIRDKLRDQNFVGDKLREHSTL